MPFCSPRCRQIDLGRWLKEAYGVPCQREEEEDEDEEEEPEGSDEPAEAEAEGG